METKEIYRTKELSEAAALIVSKQRLIQIQRQGKICWFLFENAQKCQEISDEFFFGELMANAREYYETITRLKNRIFAGQK